MKNWNWTGRIKAIIVTISVLINLITPMRYEVPVSFLSLIVIFTFGSLIIPTIIKFRLNIFGNIVERPTWNGNPLVLKKPLNFFHFGSIFFIATGFAMLVSGLIYFQQINWVGITVIVFGISSYTGVFLSLRWSNKA